MHHNDAIKPRSPLATGVLIADGDVRAAIEAWTTYRVRLDAYMRSRSGDDWDAGLGCPHFGSFGSWNKPMSEWDRAAARKAARPSWDEQRAWYARAKSAF